ncbi:MAG: WYL domain-containing protein [Coriobacteriia bacterium]
MYSAVERLVNLALYLAAARVPVSAEDIRSEVLGYAPDQADDAFKRQFERDKDDLRTAGLVIRTDAENEGYYRLDRSGTFAAPLDLNAEEAASVRAAASALLGDASFPFSDDLRLAMAKITSTIDSGDVAAAARLADEDPAQQGSIVAQLAEAASIRKSVDFGYTNSHGISAPHRVDPYGLFLHDGRWYLVGRDTALDEPRTYTVARMSDIAVNPARPKSPDFERPDGFDVASFVRLPFQYGPAQSRFDALLRFGASARWRASSLTAGHGELEADGDGMLWHVSACSRPRLLQFVVDNGSGVQLLKPADEVEALQRGLQEVLSIHG